MAESKNSRGLVVRKHDLPTASGEPWVRIPEKSVVVTGRASDLNSLLSPNKVSLLTSEQTSRPHIGIYNVEITPRPRGGINNVEYKRKRKYRNQEQAAPTNLFSCIYSYWGIFTCSQRSLFLSLIITT